MHTILDKMSPKPLYQQIVEWVENALMTGAMKPGEKLPSERDLSRYFAVNRSTIVRAMEILHDRNIIIRRVGSGTYINPQKWGRYLAPQISWNQESKQSHFHQDYRLDLGNGDLPAMLYPDLHLPEVDWQLLIREEQADSAHKLGTITLRRAVQSYLRTRFDWQVDLNHILITAGTQQAISLITLGLLKTGDAIAIENPSYFYSLSIFQALGIRIYGIPMDSSGIIIEKLDELVDRYAIKMMFINPIFHNPTGIVMSQQRKDALLAYATRKQLLIIEDDAYSQLAFSPQIETSPLKKQAKMEQILYLGSLSKYLGKSIRIGWMIAPPSIVEHLATIRQHLDSGLSSLPQFMAEIYLEQYALHHETHLQTTLKRKCEALIHWLEMNFPGTFQYQIPTGGFHLYANLRQPLQLKIIEKELQSLNVSYRRSDFFGADLPGLRFSFAHFPLSEEQNHDKA